MILGDTLTESGIVIEVGIFSPSNVAFLSSEWTDLANILGDFMTLGQVHQISAHLVHRELRNATFKGEKTPTLIQLPDSVH